MTESLSDRIFADMKDAMRKGDTERRDVIRFLRSVLGNKQIELRRPLSDDEVVVAIQTQIKQRSDAAELFRQAKRDDLVANEERQIAILNDYLPEQLSEEDLRHIVHAAAEDLGVSGPADMSKLMPRLMQEVQGRADGRTLSRIAREELARRASDAAGGAD